MVKQETDNKYFYLELAATLAGLYAVILLLKEVVGIYTFPLALGITVSFGLSFLVRRAADRSLKLILSLVACAVFIGIVYTILNSTFFYRDVVAIWIKGIFILILVLAYGVFAGEFLVYVQILGIPLFMSWPIFVKEPGALHVLLALVYLASWFAVLRLKLYVSSGFSELKSKLSYRWAIVLALTFASSLLLAAIVFWNLLPEQVKKGGLLRNNLAMQENQLDVSEQDYYDLQNQMQNGVSNVIPEFNKSSQRFAANAVLSVMVKEAPETIELKQAEDGLVSLMNTPGPGLEKGEKDHIIHLIKSYMDKKVNLNLSRSKFSVFNEMRRSMFGVPRRLAMLMQLNKMHTAQTYNRMRQASAEVREKIESYPAEMKEKEKLKDEFQKFEDWKILEIYRREMRALEVMPENLNKVLKPHLEALAQEVKEARDVEALKSAGNKIEAIREELKAREGEPGRVGELARQLQSDLGKVAEEIKKTDDPVEIPKLADKVEEIKENFEKASRETTPQAGKPKAGNFDEKIKTELEGLAQEIRNSRDIAALQKITARIEALKEELRRQAKETSKGSTPAEKKEEEKERAAAEEVVDKLKDAAEAKMALLFKEKGRELAKQMEGSSFEQAMRDALQKLEKAASLTELKAAEDKVKDAQAQIPKPDPEPEPEPSPGESETPKPQERPADKQEEAIQELLNAKAEMLLHEKMNKKEEEEEKKEEEPKPEPGKSLQDRLPWLILVVIVAGLGLIGLAFLVLYIIIMTKRSGLIRMMEKDPRGFIIMLYENAKNVLGVFGSKYQPHIPPLSYAGRVKERFALKDGALLNLTVRFEEAKYSSHNFQAADAAAALTAYNGFLNSLLAVQDKTELYFSRYPALLFRRLPTSL